MKSSGAKMSREHTQTKSWLSRFVGWVRKESLRRTVVIVILVVSLLPGILTSAISYYRSRSQIQSFVANQLYQITNSSANQLGEFARSRSLVLSEMVSNQDFINSLRANQVENASAEEKQTAETGLRNLLASMTQGNAVSEPIFSQIFLVDQNNRVVASSDSQFIEKNFTSGQVDLPVLKPFIQTTLSVPVLNPFSGSPANLVLLTSQVFSLGAGDQNFTVIGVSPTQLYPLLLKEAATFLPGARAFLVDANGTVIASGVDAPIQVMPASEYFIKAVDPVIQGIQTLQPITFSSFDNQLVLAYVRTIPDQKLSMVLQVPVSELYKQVPLIDGLSIYIMAIMLIFMAMVAYIGTSQVVNPLLHLSDIARRFANKNFDSRAQVTHKNEIGQLAASMNVMADELSVLYTNLEEQVEQRTEQMRTASEVARIATSSTRLEETLGKTVNLVNERFNLYNTAIYLTDETRRFLTLRGSSATGSSSSSNINRRIPIDASTLSGLVAGTNEPHQILDTREAAGFSPDSMSPYSRSIAAVPISIGSMVLGVLEAHSKEPNGIGSDLLIVLQTIANQISGAIQNVRLLETTQVDLDETNMLYHITRQVAAAANDQEAIQTIIESLPKLPHVSALLSLVGDQINISALYDPRSQKIERGLNTVNFPAQKMIEPLSQGNPVFVTDISIPSDFDAILTFFHRRGCRSAVILPCLQAGKPTWILVIGFGESQSTSQASLQPFFNLADVISASLDKYDVLQSLQKRLRELQVLATFSKATSSETSLSKLFSILHQLVVETMGSNLGFVIASYNQSRGIIEFPFAYDDQQFLELDPLPLGNGLTSLVIQNQEPLLLTKDTEAKAIELGAKIIGKPAKSWLGVPLMVGGQLTGALIIQDQLQEDRFSQDDLNLMMTLAPQIATAIRNTQLLEEMQHTLGGFQQDRLFLNTWLTNTPDQITIKDINGTYIYVSQSVGNRFDTLAQNLIDKSDFDLLPQENASQIFALDKAVIDSGMPKFGELEQSGTGNQQIWELVSRIPIRDASGSVAGLMSIRRNVTDMKQAEAFARDQAQVVRTTAEIARDAAGILELDELLNKSVNLIRDRFDFYHASVFLLDPLGEYAVLRESTGEAGQQMKQNHHRLAVGSKSVVGQTTAKAEPVIVPDITRDSTHFPNPLLPETRAEMAIPLIFGGKVIGALDVQSTQPNIFTPEDREILTILADQLAATIHNAELFSTAQEMLIKHKLLHQINVAATTAASLDESLERVADGLLLAQVADRISIFMLNNTSEIVLTAASGYENRERLELKITMGRGIVGAAIQERKPIRVDNVVNDPRYLPFSDQTRSELALPIVFGEELIGALNLESNEPAEFDENDQDIMAALANNLGAVIANWRLVDRIQSQVDRQKQLFDATSKIRRSVDISTILQTSIDEIGHTIGVRSAKITLVSPNPSNIAETGTAHNGNNGHQPDHNGKAN